MYRPSALSDERTFTPNASWCFHAAFMLLSWAPMLFPWGHTFMTLPWSVHGSVCVHGVLIMPPWLALSMFVVVYALS